MTLRILGGKLRGRALPFSGSATTRPSGVRLRRSLFDRLAHVYGLPQEHTQVLDLFAGTGALAIEALSRGAAFARLIDSDPKVAAHLRKTLNHLGLDLSAEVACCDVFSLLRRGAGNGLGLVLIDAPYGSGLGAKAASALARRGALPADALVVNEVEVGEGGLEVPGLDVDSVARMGRGELRFYRVADGLAV